MIEGQILKEKMKRSFDLWDDLASHLDEKFFRLDLAGLPSNTIGQQLWCVIGARQSYLRAILENGWQGFHCALTWEGTKQKSEVQKQLQESKGSFLKAFDQLSFLSPIQQSLLFDLIEHEAQHHGQLIRYLYALKVPVPPSWKKRYNLD